MRKRRTATNTKKIPLKSISKKEPELTIQQTNLFNSNESINEFLSQAKSMCDDYEKEIELLRSKINESNINSNNNQSNNINIQTNKMKTFDANLLQISNEENKKETKFEIIGNCNNYFIMKMSEISKEASPDFNMLNQIYSEKIQELFMENDNLNNTIKDHKSQKEKIKELQKTNEEIKYKLKDKEIYIENMNGNIYKFNKI
jgi:hypothetical protein